MNARLKPSPLPEVDAQANFAWREGWWTGIAVGAVLGFCSAVIFFHR